MRNNFFTFKSFVFLVMLTILTIPNASFAYPISPAGEKLNVFLDSLDVSNKWLPYHQVNWRTGEQLSRYRNSALGTHCSTFVAAAATKLGVYILRPPEHDGPLANAQYYWLRAKGNKHGWAVVENNINAQRIANQGCLVVIAYANPNNRKPGHIAIVRPSDKSRAEIVTRGPQIIQAGKKNYNSTALTSGFRKPLKNPRILYYAHNTPFCRLIVQKSVRENSMAKTV